jgi:hypothetical protein
LVFFLLALAANLLFWPCRAFSYTESVYISVTGTAAYSSLAHNPNYYGTITATVASKTPADGVLFLSLDNNNWSYGSSISYTSGPSSSIKLGYYTYSPPMTATVTLTYPYDDADPTGSITPNGWQTSGNLTIQWTAQDVAGTDNSGVKNVKLFESTPTDSDWTQLVSNNYPTHQPTVTSSVHLYTQVSGIFEYQLEVSDLARTATIDGDGNKMNVKVDLVDPVLQSISSPSDETPIAKINNPLITIAGTATDDFSGVDALSVNLNGTNCHKFSYSDSLREDFSENIDLSMTDSKIQSGINTLDFQVHDLAGRSSAIIHRSLFYDPPRVTQSNITYSNPAGLQYLGDTATFGFKINCTSKVKLSIVKNADGSGDAWEVAEGVYNANDDSFYQNAIGNTTYTPGPDNTIVFVGGATQAGKFKLVAPDGDYYFKAEFFNPDGSSYPSTVLPYISQKFNIGFKTHTVNAVVLTPSNGVKKITVPHVNIVFSKQDNPQAGMIIAEGTSNQTFEIPDAKPGVTLLYRADLSKQGYPNLPSTDIDASSTTLTCENYRPFMPVIDTNYDATVDSDNDGIPDGWEYKYWISWPNWTVDCGCDLGTSGDAQCDKDGDGLSNLRVFLMQKYFPDIDPSQKNLLVELDWVTTSINYAPQPLAKQTCSDIFSRTDLGIHVRWSSKSHFIDTMGDNQANTRSVDCSFLQQLLGNSWGTYDETDAQNYIVHAIFAPGWVVINGLPQDAAASQTSSAGLYLNFSSTPRGVFVFDLFTRNLDGKTPLNYANRAEPLINQYEGYILAHELGHVLGLKDVGNSQ